MLKKIKRFVFTLRIKLQGKFAEVPFFELYHNFEFLFEDMEGYVEHASL